MSVTLSEALRALAHEWSPDVAYLIQSAASELDRLNAAEQERGAKQFYADVPETRMPEVQIPWGHALAKSVNESMMASTPGSAKGGSPQARSKAPGDAGSTPEPGATPGAALDAEAGALLREWVGPDANLNWKNISSNGRDEWRRVALKAREMHPRKASLDDCAWVYRHSVGTPRDCLRAVLQHLGVEVTP